MALKDSKCICLKREIEQLRSELNELIGSENLTSSVVQCRSRELDELILMYIQSRDQELNEP